MSPYLSCLVMDAFSNLLEDRGFKGITLNGYAISHLLYADDVLIFGEATLENCSLLVSIIKEFACMTGLHVNHEKCAIMFPKHVHNQRDICNALSIYNISTNISYLGIPLSFYRLKIEDYMPLIDSIHKKFTGWKATILSMISLKWDHWIDNRNLCEIFGHVSIAHIPDIALSKLISDNGWTIPDNFSSSLTNVISGISINAADGPCLLWFDKLKSNFKNFMDEFHADYADCCWNRMVWHKRNALKFFVFAWLANVGGLKTADALRIRNIMVPTLCCLCQNGDETLSHLFFECSYSFSILTALIKGMATFLLRPNILQIYDWLNGSFNGNVDVLNFYKLVLSAIIYFLWKERNNRIFGNQILCHTSLPLSIKRAVSEKIFKWRNAIALLDRI
ncbi:tRNA pseudouridine38/39 synthase [Dendrobium catenatum]|uniref:tRNA pseudouridine38/39 synthase n=1 Tax=Dendrobium catenatum TaxID=906689 RepID=A0A2I0W8R5_9ASPA|nr:tRNA pseudouridine38/39 synthase [Dendrobium catenatum]